MAPHESRGHRTMNTKTNENWGTCLKCGEPVLLHPQTDAPEPCATCASRASKQTFAMGVVLLTAGVVAIVGLVYLCIRILI
jgi:hypothetical protein